MTSQIKGLVRSSMGLLVGLALMTSCGGDSASEAEVGKIQLPLQTTSVEGVDFWLRGCFEITGPSYPQPEVVCTEGFSGGAGGVGGSAGTGAVGGSAGTGGTAGGGATEINLSVKSGDYQVFLQGGWWLEYSADGQPLALVDPAKVQLLSANPQTATVVADELTVVAIRFQVDQTAIDFGLGTLGIEVAVDVTGTLLVFITEAEVSPGLSDSVFQARGVADAVCQGEADAAGLVGTFRAWLAADLALGADYSPSEWGPAMRAGGYRFFVAGGGLFADSWDDLLQYVPSSSIDRTAKGEPVPANTRVWTGTSYGDGTPYGLDCGGWTNVNPLQSPRGAVGTTGNGALWWDFYGVMSCTDGLFARTLRLYCFQQP